MAGDDEMIFTIPKSKLEDLLLGLRHCEEYGSRLPRNCQMRREPEFPEGYVKIAKLLGLRE